jgi:hypothetical protein
MHYAMGAIDTSLSRFRKDQQLRRTRGFVYPYQHVTAEKEVRMCARGAKAKAIFVKYKYIKGKFTLEEVTKAEVGSKYTACFKKNDPISNNCI